MYLIIYICSYCEKALTHLWLPLPVHEPSSVIPHLSSGGSNFRETEEEEHLTVGGVGRRLAVPRGCQDVGCKNTKTKQIRFCSFIGSVGADCNWSVCSGSSHRGSCRGGTSARPRYPVQTPPCRDTREGGGGALNKHPQTRRLLLLRPVATGNRCQGS